MDIQNIGFIFVVQFSYEKSKNPPLSTLPNANTSQTGLPLYLAVVFFMGNHKLLCPRGNIAKRDNHGHCHCEKCTERRRIYKISWREKTKEERRKQYKIYRENNLENELNRAKNWRINNRKRANNNSNEWQKRQRKTNLNFKIKNNLRCRIWKAIKRENKTLKTMDFIGCTIHELKIHLEMQFTEGMNWDNYGKWEIDHIKPCSKFDLTDIEQQKICFHYTNLQPLWQIDNLKKGAK